MGGKRREWGGRSREEMERRQREGREQNYSKTRAWKKVSVPYLPQPSLSQSLF